MAVQTEPSHSDYYYDPLNVASLALEQPVNNSYGGTHSHVR